MSRETKMNLTTSTSSSSEKEDLINQCLEEDQVNLWKLRELGLSEGGFLNNTLRRKIWPLLTGLNSRQKNAATSTSAKIKNEIKFIQDSKTPISFPNDFDQVDRDVVRCSWHLLNGSQRAKRRQLSVKNVKRKAVEDSLQLKQGRLGDLVKMVLRDGKGSFRYYQGYHELACIFLTVLAGKNIHSLGLAKACLHQVSKSHLKDAMGADFSTLVCLMKFSFFPLLKKFDKQIHDHLIESEVVEPFFAISWLITWFSHDIRDTALVSRIFDAILSSHPLFPLYLCIAMVLHPINRVELLFAECDFSSLHQTLACLPKNSCTAPPEEEEEHSTFEADEDASMTLSTISTFNNNPVPFQDIILRAIAYMKSVPPSKLILLSKLYHRNKFKGDISKIYLLRPPSSWLLTTYAPKRPRVSSEDYVTSVTRQGLPPRTRSLSPINRISTNMSTANAFVTAGLSTQKSGKIYYISILITPLILACLFYSDKGNYFIRQIQLPFRKTPIIVLDPNTEATPEVFELPSKKNALVLFQKNSAEETVKQCPNNDNQPSLLMKDAILERPAVPKHLIYKLPRNPYKLEKHKGTIMPKEEDHFLRVIIRKMNQIFRKLFKSARTNLRDDANVIFL